MSQVSHARVLDGPAFDSDEPGALFLPAARACLDVLCARFPRYANFVASRIHGDLAKLCDSLASLDRLPAVFLPVLKTFEFPLPAEASIVRTLTSSGTTGQPSRTPLDEPSWERRVRAMLGSYRAMGLLDGDRTALAFLLDPATTQMAGSVVIDGVLRAAPQVKSVQYLARLGPTGPQFDVAQAAAALAAAAGQGPVVLVGYPALIAAAMQGLAHAGQTVLPLPAGSRILTGGGWKGFLPGVRLDQDEFRQRAAAFFAVPPRDIRDMFGLSECPAVFVQCEEGRYHVPAWCWAQAIDPETGREVPADQDGLLQLTTPLTTSYPLLRILTTDRVTIGRACACGRVAPYIVPRGRTTAARYETCAMKIGKAVA